MERRQFLKLLGAGAVAVATFNPFEVFATTPTKVIIVKSGETFESIIRRECNLKTLYRYYAIDNIWSAIQSLAKFNSTSTIKIDPNKIKIGDKIRIPVTVLKDRSEYRKFQRKKGKDIPKKTTGFRSPFGGYTKPIFHKCPFNAPLKARICPFDEKGAGRGKRRHKGLDLFCSPGTRLYPMLPGEVIFAQKVDLRKRGEKGRLANNGKHVKIKSKDGFVHMYLHMDRVDVNLGQEVEHNTLLGLSGATGNAESTRRTNPHVHLQLRRYGILRNPLKFLSFLK